MANFEIQGPDGKKYQVQGENAEGALAALKKMLSGPQPLGENDRETRATNPAREYSSFGWMPISKSKGTGEVGFDLSGGITGAFLNAWRGGSKTMEDVAEGRLDPTSQQAVTNTIEPVLLASPMSPAVRVAEKVIPGTLRALRQAPAKVPTEQELKAAGVAGFKQVREMGVDYSPEAVKSMANDLRASLENDGILAELAPTTFSVLSKLDTPEVGAGERAVLNINGLIAARRSFQEIAKKVDEKGNPTTDAAAASRAIDALDNFIVGAGEDMGGTGIPGVMLPGNDAPRAVAGPAADAASVFSDARANYAASKRAKDIEGREYKAEIDTAAANSGLNLDNRLRQTLKSILLKRKEGRGYSKEELALIEDIVRGKYGANAARYWGSFLGGGGGLGATSVTGIGGAAGAAIGTLLGGVPGAAVGGLIGSTVPNATGFALRKLAGSLTQSRVRSLDEMVRKRSPLYQQALKRPNSASGLRPEIRSIIDRALLLEGMNLQGSR